MLHSISFEDIPVKKLQECPTFRHSSTFSEVTESINVLQNYINNIGIGATNEKVILKSELANSALTNYNRQLPLHGQSASLNFAKPIAKGPLQNQSQNQLHPSEYRKVRLYFSAEINLLIREKTDNQGQIMTRMRT